MRIGELARRVGVPASTLRAWERRYGFPRPARTEGGHRHYDERALPTLRRVVALVEAGIRVSVAIDQVLAEPAAAPDPEPHAAAMWRAAEAFDEAGMRRALLEGSALLGTAAFLDGMLVPVLRRLGAEWRAAPRNVAREHFTTTMVRSHLLWQLADGDGGSGPLALAAAPGGETHDIGVVMAALAVADAGWRPIVLGAQTPWSSVESLLGELHPQLLLVGAQSRPPAARLLAAWRTPPPCAVILGGTGFRADDAAGRPRTAYHGGPYATLSSLAATL